MSQNSLPPHTLASPDMPCTEIVGSDSYGGRCRSVDGKRAVFVNSSGKAVSVSMRKDGYYREVGKPMEGFHYWVLGISETKLDPHF